MFNIMTSNEIINFLILFYLLLRVKLSLITFFALFVISVLCFLIDCSIYSFIYQLSFRSFSILEAIAKSILLIFARKSDNNCCCNCWKSDNYMGSKSEKKRAIRQCTQFFLYFGCPCIIFANSNIILFSLLILTMMMMTLILSCI